MAGLFRRRRRSKKGSEEPEGSAPEPAIEEGEASPATEVETAPAPEAGALPAAAESPTSRAREPAAPLAGPSAPEVGASPPPLPEADREAARSSVARRRPQTQCFLCSSPLVGAWCPTCRMEWIE